MKLLILDLLPSCCIIISGFLTTFILGRGCQSPVLRNMQRDRFLNYLQALGSQGEEVLVPRCWLGAQRPWPGQSFLYTALQSQPRSWMREAGQTDHWQCRPSLHLFWPPLLTSWFSGPLAQCSFVSLVSPMPPRPGVPLPLQNTNKTVKEANSSSPSLYSIWADLNTSLQDAGVRRRAGSSAGVVFSAPGVRARGLGS